MNIKMILLIAALVVALVLVTYGAVVYIRSHSLEQIRAEVYQLFLIAETNMKGTKKGQERLNWVVNKAYYLLPRFVQGLISVDFLRSVLNKWFKAIKDLLDDGKINNSVSDSDRVDEGDEDHGTTQD